MVEKGELCFHQINALLERVFFQLKLSPKGNYREAIVKAKELWLMYSHKDKVEQANQLDITPGCECLEEALQHIAEQMAVMGRQQCGAPRNPSYKRPRGPVECYHCG